MAARDATGSTPETWPKARPCYRATQDDIFERCCRRPPMASESRGMTTRCHVVVAWETFLASCNAAGATSDEISEFRCQLPVTFVSRDVTKRSHVMVVLEP